MTAPLFGIININKSRYVTSRAVVNAVYRVVKPAKAGHAGTLDPMATGVVLVCVGRATRLVSRIQNLPKTYRTRFVFGQTSDTDDSTGSITETNVATPNAEQIEATLQEFIGDIQQVPPAFSAVHVNGKRAYKLARRGEAVELKAKTVHVSRFQLLAVNGAEAEFEIECGSGTYIRSLARDMGERLGCGGLMSALERTRIGPFLAEDGLRPGGGEEPKQEITRENVENAIVNPLTAMPWLVRRECTDIEVNLVQRGHAISCDDCPPGKEVALTRGTEFIALGEFEPDSRMVQPRVVFDAIQ